MTLRSKRHARRPLGALLRLEDRTVPAAAFLLTDDALLAFDTANPAAAGTPATVTGLNAGETLVGIDVRPQTGLLYGLGVDADTPGLTTATLYTISPTGAATAIGTPGGITLTDAAGTTAVDLPDPAAAGYGFDFNPAADRIRVVTSTGLNFRVNPNTGGVVDTDTGTTGNQGDPSLTDGTNPAAADGAAYTSNTALATATALYVLDAATDQLLIQGAVAPPGPNGGVLSGGVGVTVGGAPLDFTSVNGFDIATAGSPAADTAYAALTVGGVTNLYTIDLATGTATLVDTVGDGTGVARGLAVQGDAGGFPAVALSGDGTQLVRFASGDPTTASTATTITVGGVAIGANLLVGIDYRPATGTLYGLTVDPATDAATLHVIDTQTGVVSTVGSASFVQADGTTPVELPDPATTGYGIDFNPVNGLLRVVAENGLNFRINPATGAGEDGDAVATGTQTDPAVTGLPGGSTGVSAAAYTNTGAGATATTLYTLDAGSDSLFIQGQTAPPGPNGGVQTLVAPVALTVGGTALDFTAVNGFDIPAGVDVATGGTTAAGLGYALLTVGGTTNLYSIDLTTGQATDLGAVAGLTGGAGLALGAAPAQTVAVNPVAVAVNEGGTTATVTLTRTGNATGPLTVTVAVSGGTATAGNDFGAVPASVTFAAGEKTATFDVPITEDTEAEAAETIILEISAPTGGGVLGADTTATVTIADNEPTTLQFAVAADSAGEADGTVDVVVTRTGDTSTAVTVDVAVTGGDATDPGDFGPFTTTTVSFAAGETSKTVSVPVAQDTDLEASETIVFGLTNATGGAVVGAQATETVTILDDEPSTIAFAAATSAVAEDAAAGNVVITLTRTGDLTNAADVTVTPTFGSATAPDFGTIPTTVSFAAGQATATLTIPVVNDVPFEGNETVDLTLSAPTGGAVLGAQVTNTLTVTDAEDNPGTIAFTLPTFLITETGTTATLTLDRTGGSAGAVTVTVTPTFGAGAGAASAGDFGAIPTTVSFAAGATTATLTIPVTDDAVFEGDEAVTLTLSAPTGGATLGAQAAATLTVTDAEDDPGTVAFTAPTFTVAEAGGSAQVTITRSGSTAAAVSVTLAVTGGTATATADFGAVPTTATFAAGESTITVNIPVVNDTDDEPDETILLAISAPTGGATLGAQTTATVTIGDDDAAPSPGVVQFTTGAFAVDESDGAVSVTLNRTGGTAGAVTVTIAVTGGTATAGTDFGAVPATVTFLDGQANATVVIPVENDDADEPAETIVLTISAPTGGATLGAQTATTVTIADDDDPPAAQTIAFDAATATVSENGGSVTFGLTRTGDTTAAASVTLAVTGGTATAGTDFGAVPATVTFAAGEDTADVTIPITDNAADNPDRTIVLTISAPTGGATLGTQTTTTVTITDDDPAGPTAPADNRVTVGGQPNGTVQVFTVGADGKLTPAGAPVTPFPGFAGTVRSTTGDVNGDGTLDTIYVTGPGTPLRMTVVSGAAGNAVLVLPTAPFSGSEDFTGGGFVTAADVDGDGRAEFAVTPDEGGGPRVTIFGLTAGGTAPAVRANFFGIADAAFRGGARAALGDVDNDGTPDLAVAAGFLGGPRIALYDGATLLQPLAAGAAAPPKLVNDFFGFPEPEAVNLRNGVFVAIGDLTGDGFGELIVGAGPGGAPRVFVMNGQLLTGAGGVQSAYAAPVANFFVGGNDQDRGGVRVATADQDNNGRADLVVGSGEGEPARVRTYLAAGFPATGEPTGFQDLVPFGGAELEDGIYVG